VSKTLKVGTHRLVLTAGVNLKVANDSAFAKLVWKSLLRFNRGDWGDASSLDWELNDRDTIALNSGDYGRVLAKYSDRFEGRDIWIIRDSIAVIVMFPNEH
tara:strand:- start:136 stop:438 length:303 start_codon:yes stop_codon:yes gene_type:complete